MQLVFFFLLTSQLYQSYKCDMAIYYIIILYKISSQLKHCLNCLEIFVYNMTFKMKLLY